MVPDHAGEHGVPARSAGTGKAAACGARLSRLSPGSGGMRRLLLSFEKGPLGLRVKKKERKRKKNHKNPTHFSELLSQFPFTPGMMVKLASPTVRPQTAFQPHFLRATGSGALLLPPGQGAPRPARTTFPAFPYPRYPSRRCQQPPRRGGG